jgi:macrolide transport system ATP-binding/permease protein
MNDLSVRFINVKFAYETASQPLVHGLSVHLVSGWTGVVGANGVGKSTILKLATGILKPQLGQIAIPGNAIYCEQRTDTVPDQLEELVNLVDGHGMKIREQMGIRSDWPQRWATLSHGERKRAQIAVALWRRPAVLALDEPTNHLDGNARNLLSAALSTFRGVGILVSHDRELLDSLCTQCLFVEPPHALLRPGNYSRGMKQAERDELAAQKQRATARQNLEKLQMEAGRRRDEAAQADRKRSKRGLARHDNDARAKIDLARVTGKDGAAGRRLRQLEGRLLRAEEELGSITVKKTHTLGIWMPGTKSQRNTLFRIPAGSIPLGGNGNLRFPDLVMTPDDRIALTGPNGCGKSTLIKHILQSLNIEPEHLTYIPQEIDIHASRDVLLRARALPREKLGHMMVIISRLGSRPQRVLETDQPSPGEIRKVLLASGITMLPHLILMDEPTNHLDLPSIECLERALADCPCGLFLVSHDRGFLNALTNQEWRISHAAEKEGDYVLRM